MPGLLDQVLANTPVGGAVILSENHDANSINWVGGVSDPGEMVGCGQYQQLRRQNGESDDAYQTRLLVLLPTLPADDRAVIEAGLKVAALRRASLDDSTGKIALMVAGKAPWHKLGVNVSEAVDSATAIKLASMDWEVQKQDLFYTDATGTKRPAPGVFGLVRQDTGTMLGNVGSMTKVIQNSEGFKFLDDVRGKFGAKFVSAGSIHGGKKVWMQVALPNQTFAVQGTDAVDAYAIFTNCHDGSGSARCFPTSERVVCANTFRIAVTANGRDGISIPHFGKLDAKIAAAQEALGLAVDGFTDFAGHAETLASTPANITHYANDVLDAVLEVTAADALAGVDLWAAVMKATAANQELERKSFAKKLERRGEVLADVLERYESETNGKNGIRGTAWAAFNAVTESADHGLLGVRHVGSEENRNGQRFESVLNGRADSVKQIAFAKAVALAN